MINNILIVVFLLCESFEDIKNRTLKLNKLIIFLGIGILQQIADGKFSLNTVVLGVVPGVILLIISYLSGEAIGYGDGAVVLILGALAGYKCALLSFAIGCVMAMVPAMIQYIRNPYGNRPLPFIPCLFAGYLGGFII